MPELARSVGRYEIVRELGRGGMAVVHLARQVDLDRLVALKELAAFHAADPAFARRFVRESRLAGSLVHPNVITVFDYLEHAGTPYIAMEYLERGSLRPYVERMTPAQIGGVLEGLLAGLAAAEQRGIVHRDLKPENLMVTSDGRVKIADFGIAKATQAAETGAFVTATGTTVGTPTYMAPEQAMAREVGPWTDLYSVGCMAYELFTGRPPFHDTDEPMAILLRHVTERMPPAREVAEVDPDVSAWIERLTAKDPKERPPSASAAGDELEEILIGGLGPRWRREARLPEPPVRVPGPATPPPSGPAPPMEGIDMEGTGPDTGEAVSAADPPEASVYETYRPPPAGAPPLGPPPVGPPPGAPSERVPAEPAPPPPPPPAVAPAPAVPAAVAPPDPAAVAETRLPPAADARRPTEPAQERRAVRPPSAAVPLARAGALALLLANLIPVATTGPDRWNAFAVLSPFEALGAAAAALLVTRRPAALLDPAAAGVLLGFGGLASITSLGLLKFALERLDALGTVLALAAFLGALAMLAAGVLCARSAPREGAAAPMDPATLVLGLAGTALASVALFVNYDGFSSLWTELQEGESAEFFLEPALAAVTMLVSLMLVGARPRLASGVLLAVGAATALHFLGLLVAAWRAIGEVGEIRAAGFIGILGGVLVLVAGILARRASSSPASPSGP